jgi:hypothetical protein
MTRIVRRPVPDAAAALAAAGVHPVLARVFAARGVVAADELDTTLARLPPFETMKGIDAAAARLADAIARAERIVIVADYDADGATACAVGVRGLAAMGANVDFLVPNRFDYATASRRPSSIWRWPRTRNCWSPSTTASPASRAWPTHARSGSTCWSPTTTCRRWSTARWRCRPPT